MDLFFYTSCTGVLKIRIFIRIILGASLHWQSIKTATYINRFLHDTICAIVYS